jgi:chemotaxis regulatin CheY-phosphate phosphatase CheZ
MTSLIKPPVFDANAFEQIEAAVMETERGRWFLNEYARRNRHAETESILDAIDKLSRNMNTRPLLIGTDQLYPDILDMARAILRTEKEIRAMRGRDGGTVQFAAASETLDAVIGTTEQATSAILSAAERVQEQAWTMREQGEDPEICDQLDRSATEIYTACSFQDLTAQRIAKAVETLKFLDQRIRTLVDAAGLSDAIAEEIEDIDATMAMEAETEKSQPDIWMSEANQAEIDDTFDFFTPAEQAEPTMVGADLLDIPPVSATVSRVASFVENEVDVALAPLDIEAELRAHEASRSEDEVLFDDMADILAEPTTPHADGPSPLDSLDELSTRDRLRAFR